MNPIAKEVKYLEEYKLLVSYLNNEKKIFDITNLLSNTWFAPLENKEIYKLAKVVCGTLEWPNGIDICPDDLYNNSIPYLEKPSNCAEEQEAYKF